jgi:hypothetical protein
MGAGAIGVQIQILLLDLVFHVTPRTVKVFITPLGAEAIRGLLVVVKTFGRQVGDDKTRIVFVPLDFRFADHPATERPTFKCLILELCKATRHPAA